MNNPILKKLAAEAMLAMFGCTEEEMDAKTEVAYKAIADLEPIEIGYLLVRVGAMQKHISMEAAKMGDTMSKNALNEVSAAMLATAQTIIHHDKMIKAAINGANPDEAADLAAEAIKKAKKAA